MTSADIDAKMTTTESGVFDLEHLIGKNHRVKTIHMTLHGLEIGEQWCNFPEKNTCLMFFLAFREIEYQLKKHDKKTFERVISIFSKPSRHRDGAAMVGREELPSAASRRR